MIDKGSPPPTEFSSKQQWKQKYPLTLSGILAFVQILLTIVIIGCEIGSMLIDVVTATVYVGIWAGLFFINASISQAASSCCCHSRGCATYTLVNQCIALLFAICVIIFDAYFLFHTTTCFYSFEKCHSSAPTRGLYYTKERFNDIKLPLIRGQLAAASLMFVLCLIFIIIYIKTAVQVGQPKTAPSTHLQTEYQRPEVPTGPDGMITPPRAENVRAQRAGSPLYYRPTIVVDNGDGRTNDLQCPICRTTMAVTVRKKTPLNL